jgi:hypothetical protein
MLGGNFNTSSGNSRAYRSNVGRGGSITNFVIRATLALAPLGYSRAGSPGP